MIQNFFKQDSERSSALPMAALVDGLVAFLAVGLVAFGIDAIFRSMH